MRVATLNTGLVRAGPGLLLRDIEGGKDTQVTYLVDMIVRAAPDILVITGFDHDYAGLALAAFVARLDAAGAPFRYQFSNPPNSGVPTGLDMDHDGRLGRPSDAQGYGEFAGQGGMAVLSRRPILTGEVRDFSKILWRDLPGARLPEWSGQPDIPAHRVQRLSSVAHWDVPVRIAPEKVLRVLAWHANTPAFDGAEDRNGLRNRDENLFWLRYLDGDLDWPPPEAAFVLAGDANLDPVDGDGDRAVMARILADRRLRDPQPKGRKVLPQADADQRQTGDPAMDTAVWPGPGGPGNLRVDYVLPSADLSIVDAGIVWPEEAAFSLTRRNGKPLAWHGLVWVDLLWE